MYMINITNKLMASDNVIKIECTGELYDYNSDYGTPGHYYPNKLAGELNVLINCAGLEIVISLNFVGVDKNKLSEFVLAVREKKIYSLDLVNGAQINTHDDIVHIIIENSECSTMTSTKNTTSLPSKYFIHKFEEFLYLNCLSPC